MATEAISTASPESDAGVVRTPSGWSPPLGQCNHCTSG